MPSTGDLARLFALVNAGMADAGIVAWRAKYYYNLWRPAIGVREDDAATGPTGLGSGSGAKGDPFWWPHGAPLSNQPGPGRKNSRRISRRIPPAMRPLAPPYSNWCANFLA